MNKMQRSAMVVSVGALASTVTWLGLNSKPAYESPRGIAQESNGSREAEENRITEEADLAAIPIRVSGEGPPGVVSVLSEQLEAQGVPLETIAQPTSLHHKYAGKSIAQLNAALQELGLEVSQEQMAIGEALVEAGHADVFDPHWADDNLAYVAVGGKKRVAISRAVYPNFYERWDEVAWLRQIVLPALHSDAR